MQKLCFQSKLIRYTMMIETVSKARFIKEIADFTGDVAWKYKGSQPAVIIFHDSEHRYDQDIKLIYEPLAALYPLALFLQVLIDRDAELAHAYDIYQSPTMMFIPTRGKPIFMRGSLTYEEAKDNIRLLVEGKMDGFRL